MANIQNLEGLIWAGRAFQTTEIDTNNANTDILVVGAGMRVYGFRHFSSKPMHLDIMPGQVSALAYYNDDIYAGGPGIPGILSVGEKRQFLKNPRYVDGGYRTIESMVQHNNHLFFVMGNGIFEKTEVLEENPFLIPKDGVQQITTYPVIINNKKETELAYSDRNGLIKDISDPKHYYLSSPKSDEKVTSINILPNGITTKVVSGKIYSTYTSNRAIEPPETDFEATSVCNFHNALLIGCYDGTLRMKAGNKYINIASIPEQLPIRAMTMAPREIVRRIMEART